MVVGTNILNFVIMSNVVAFLATLRGTSPTESAFEKTTHKEGKKMSSFNSKVASKIF